MFNIWDDLLAFTGMSESELTTRLQRKGRHHFAMEHAFAKPQSEAELSFYYRASIGYLWGNSLHSAKDIHKWGLKKSDGPVMDYSGGVGQTILALASKGIEAVYFGIGLMEYEFTQFRVRRHGFEGLVKFVKPYGVDDRDGKLKFDPVFSMRKGVNVPELGAVLAFDVFEHIPRYEVLARHLISLLRPGGKLIESSPFSKGQKSGTAIHLKQSMPLTEALTGMRLLSSEGTTNVWVKK